MNNKVVLQLIMYSIALIVIITSLEKCRCKKEKSPITETKLEQKKSILDEEVKVLRNTLVIYKDRWRTIVKKGDSVFVRIYQVVPDTCASYLDTLYKWREIERNEANLVHYTDSLIIGNLDSLNKVNDAIIGRYKGEVVVLCDSINKVRRRSYWRGLKHGFVAGASAVEVINLIQK